jgi:hypothetical protein
MNNVRTNPDGYELDGYVKAREGFWDACEFTYRPMTHPERIAYEDAQAKAAGAKKSAIVCEAISRHLKTWNEVDEKGNAIAPTPANIALLKNGFLVDRLYNIVSGWELSDERVSETSGEVSAEASDLIDAALEGMPPGILKTERAAKNS